MRILVGFMIFGVLLFLFTWKGNQLLKQGVRDHYWTVLCRLQQRGGTIRVKDLADDLNVDAPIVLTILEQQEANGFVFAGAKRAHLGSYEQAYMISPQGLQAILDIADDLEAAGLPVPQRD